MNDVVFGSLAAARWASTPTPGLDFASGDYLYTPAGASHEAVAHTQSVLLLSFPKPPVFGPPS